MRRINYPKKNKDFEVFKNDFKERILKSNLLNKLEIEKFLKRIGVKLAFEEILVLPIEDLINLPEISSTNIYRGLTKKQVTEEKAKIGKIFNYATFQGKVLSEFFMKYGKELNIKTCCYCNIDFVNSYIPLSNDYWDFSHFMDTCIKNDLIKIVGIGESFADIILKRYKGQIKSYSDIEIVVKEKRLIKILKGITDKSDKLNLSMINVVNKNHFTLDHVLPQNEYPYLSLSLFNLTPSCYSCNSKLKKDSKIYTDVLEISSVSPTGLEEITDLNFKIYFKDNFHESYLPNSFNEYSIKLESKHTEFMEKLNLQGRYNFHKDVSLELIEKRKIYSDSQIQEIAKLLKNRVNEVELKRQIFGNTIFEENSNQQFEKYKKDIAKQLGII